jgi:pimeloyl-ACP methyl ester carboxylesterase
MPVVIVAGTEDRVSEAQQSAELHRDIAHSALRCIPSTGHMVHQTATAEVMSAIDMVATQKKEPAKAVQTTKRHKQTLGASVT